MRRSADFDATVKRGRRSAQPDMVIYMRRANGYPRVGLIVSRSVGSAVQRHAVSRRLRHVARGMIPDLTHSEHVVIRALPGSRTATSARLETQLRTGLRRIHEAGPKR
jgi:ribonuclease P protein component